MVRWSNVLSWVVPITLLVFARAMHAEDLRIGEAQGALYDGILDGYPGVALFDGTPDLSDNPPSVALKFGVLEMRTVAEFPVGSLSPETIERAELYFNIDDVIATFGPGADFSGRAAARIRLHPYCGDGRLDLEDFLRTQQAAHEIDTTPFGTITDAVIARNGPIVFSADISAEVRELLEIGCQWLGVVFRTLDNNTATSLDDLGDGGSYGGSKGANGAFLPYLLLHLATPEPSPTPTATFTPTFPPSPPATATPTQAVPPSPTPSPSVPAPPFACAGDCDSDGNVNVAEILLAVRIALELESAGICAPADTDADGAVTVTDIIRAVQSALDGCP